MSNVKCFAGGLSVTVVSSAPKALWVVMYTKPNKKLLAREGLLHKMQMWHTLIRFLWAKET